MYDLEKSDVIICNKKANNMYKYRRENDALFLQRFNMNQPTDIRNVNLEAGLFRDSLDPRKYICNEAINSRGGNAVPCEKGNICSGFKCYSEYHMNDYLLIPCKTNTWNNYVECDNNKCCSVHHQMYDNITKRR